MSRYVPKAGDLVWLSFNPQAGHEQAGTRPALCLSPANYNAATGLGLFCPVTSKTKGYPFEVEILEGLPISGVVLADQLKNLDWTVRNIKFICESPADLTEGVKNQFKKLL